MGTQIIEIAESFTVMRTLVITGATRGLGLRTVELVLARPDWRIISLGRTPVTTPEIELHGKGRLDFISVDLADLRMVDAACDEVLKRLDGSHISALALNAGLQSNQPDHSSKDGIEIHFAVNHLAHVLIADRLAPSIEPGGHIVVTSSEVHDPEVFCLLGITRAAWQDPYDFANPVRSQDHIEGLVNRGESRYCASKLCNVMHARVLAKEYPALSAVSFNPSVVPGTGIARERNALQRYLWRTLAPALAPIVPGMRHVNQSAGDLAWLLCDADLKPTPGSYYDGRAPDPGSPDSRDPAKIARVMQVSRDLITRARSGARTLAKV